MDLVVSVCRMSLQTLACLLLQIAVELSVLGNLLLLSSHVLLSSRSLSQSRYSMLDNAVNKRPASQATVNSRWPFDDTAELLACSFLVLARGCIQCAAVMLKGTVAWGNFDD